MMKHLLIILSMQLLLACSSTSTDLNSTNANHNTIKSIHSNEDSGMEIFILAGQSNMAGRGLISEQDKVAHPRIVALSKENTWKPAVAPIHFDKKQAGVGLGKSFALAHAEKNKDITIGLVPTACGGSSLDVWVPGGYHKQTKSYPYDDFLTRSKLAMQSGDLKAILWHQGESDSRMKKARGYKTKLISLIKRFRKDLNAPNLPIIIGQLGQFPQKPWKKGRELVNKAHIEIANELPFVTFVSSDGLTPIKDITHFDSKSLRIFGKRYYDAYLKLIAE